MPSSYYSEHIQELRNVYDRALENHHFDQLIVFSGEIKKQFQDDMPYPFFVNVQFKAIVPLTNTPESWIIWRLGEKPLLLLYQPDDFWHVVPELPESFWTTYFDIKVIKEKEKAQQYFGDTQHSAFLGETTKLIQSWGLGEQNPESLIAELNWYRSFKTAYEQSCIREANRISAKGHLAARDAFYNGASELDISLAFQQACQQSEELLAYPSIVGINQHASILHYWGRERLPPKEHYSLLIDAAASCNGYPSDITRTYAYKSGLFSDMIVELDKVQQTLANEHKVGLRYFDVRLIAMQSVSKLLKDSGLVSLDPESCVETGIVDHFMPHSLGHFLGLQVHDVANNQADVTGNELEVDPKYPKSKMMRTIEPNQLVTVEPGIYFIDSLLKKLYNSEHKSAVSWETIDELKPYGGIRIEDNVLITQEGPQNLTRKVFDDIAHVT